MNETHKSVSVTDLKARLSECLRQVKHGEQWVVTERGRPIAVLGPSPRPESDLAELAAAGVVRQGCGTLPPEFWELPSPSDPQAAVRRAVDEEREQGW